MKKIIFLMLFVFILVIPGFAQLSPTNQVLLNDIFVSELDYREILNRWSSLNDMPFPTPEELLVKEDYARKLAHDQDYIQKQITKLKALGVNFTGVAVLNARQVALDALKANEQAQIAGFQEDIRVITDDPNIPDEEKARLIAELQERIMVRQNRKALIDSLKAGSITWTIE